MTSLCKATQRKWEFVNESGLRAQGDPVGSAGQWTLGPWQGSDIGAASGGEQERVKPDDISQIG